MSITENMSQTSNLEIPELTDWTPTEDQLYYVYESGIVSAKYCELLGLHESKKSFCKYIIDKKHFKDRIKDVLHHINYFLTYFDTEHELFNTTLSVKYLVDTNYELSIKAFINLVLDRIITPTFITNIEAMTDHLYTINIDSDDDAKYYSTPKITNSDAKRIIMISFTIRCILPLCIHYSEKNIHFVNKKDYIKCFNKLFVKIIKRFEKHTNTPILNVIARFTEYRVNRSYNADYRIWLKKQQLYGMVPSLYLDEVINEVIIVKSLYKIDYNRSVVSFIDGVIFRHHLNFKKENFKYKPVEIDPSDVAADEDNHISHAEAIEMSVYQNDETKVLINNANTKKVLQDLKHKFNLHIQDEEFNFYFNNIRLSSVTDMFLITFYSRYFHDTNAIYNLNATQEINLLLFLKKFLQLKGMIILPQICTAKVKGKYKENVIKNNKVIEQVQSSSVYRNIIEEKYKYIRELPLKDDPLMKQLSSFINSTFEFVDYDSSINGFVYEDVNTSLIISEFLLYLSII